MRTNGTVANVARAFQAAEDRASVLGLLQSGPERPAASLQQKLGAPSTRSQTDTKAKHVIVVCQTTVTRS